MTAPQTAKMPRDKIRHWACARPEESHQRMEALTIINSWVRRIYSLALALAFPPTLPAFFFLIRSLYLWKTIPAFFCFLLSTRFLPIFALTGFLESTSISRQVVELLEGSFFATRGAEMRLGIHSYRHRFPPHFQLLSPSHRLQL